MKWFTMFTNALNAYWNMMSADLPRAVKSGQIMHALGDVTAMSLSGVGIALVAGALHGGDDERKKKRMAVGILSQYTDSIPLLGAYVTALLETSMGLPTYGGAIEIFPAAKSFTTAVSATAKEDYEKAVENVIEGLGYALGLPVPGPRRIIRAVGQKYFGALLGWTKEE